MAEYLAPGVYVEEIELGTRPIEGVSTSTAGFLGPTERGPVAPQLLTNFLQYTQLYGGFLDTSHLAYAVDGFFRNGGQRCFMGRIVGSGAATARFDLGPVRAEAIGPGEWGNRIFVKVENGSLWLAEPSPRSELFKLTLYYWRMPPPDVGGAVLDPLDSRNRTNPNRREPDVLEVYDNLSPNPASSDYYERRINGISRLIRIVREANGRPNTQGSAEASPPDGTLLNTHLA